MKKPTSLSGGGIASRWCGFSIASREIHYIEKLDNTDKQSPYKVTPKGFFELNIAKPSRKRKIIFTKDKNGRITGPF